MNRLLTWEAFYYHGKKDAYFNLCFLDITGELCYQMCYSKFELPFEFQIWNKKVPSLE